MEFRPTINALIGRATILGLLALSGTAHANARSGTIAVSPDGNQVAVVNNDSGSVTFISALSHSVLAELAVGRDPRTITFSRGGSHAFVTNRADDSVSIIDVSQLDHIGTWPACDDPAGIVAVDDDRLLISCFGADRLLVLDPDKPEKREYVDVGDAPMGLVFDDASGKAYVSHFFTGEVSVVDTKTLSVDLIVATGDDSNIANGLVLSPLDDTLWMPHTRSNTGNQALLFDTTVFPVVSAIEIENGFHQSRRRLHLDIVDEPVNMPFDAVIDSRGVIFIANAGSNDVSVIDLADGQLRAHIEVGHNPRGLALNSDESVLYVNNNLSGSVSIIDTTSFQVVDEISVTAIPLEPAVLNGKRLFHSSDRTDLARDQWISCATCHFDGEMDKRTWFFPDGPRNTTSLLGVGETRPLHWSGDLNELQDVEITIRGIQAGTGLAPGADHCRPACDLGPPNAGRSLELDDLAEFMVSLELSTNPNRSADGSISRAARRGRVIFESAATGCSNCHVPPLFMDGQRHDVGTARSPLERKGSAFDTPSLRGIHKTEPYLHDGSANTLLDVLVKLNPDDRHGRTSHLSAPQLADLVTYLETLGDERRTFTIDARVGGSWVAADGASGWFLVTVSERGRRMRVDWFPGSRSSGHDVVHPAAGEPTINRLSASGGYAGARAELNFPAGSRLKSMILEFPNCDSGTVRLVDRSEMVLEIIHIKQVSMPAGSPCSAGVGHRAG